MTETKEKNWLDILRFEFEHPAIVLWRAVELKHIDEILNRHNLGEITLDLGCAEGKIADALFIGKKLIGLDNCWELLRQNRKSEVYKALILADGCHMPFKDAAFGSIFSNCVIEHIPDINTVLKEVSRVLTYDGIFLFSVPSHKFADFLFFSILFDTFSLKVFSNWYKTKRNQRLNHFHCYDHGHWRQILELKGFDLIEYKYYMTREATFVWDFLAILGFILKFIYPLRSLLPKSNKWFGSLLNKYYKMDSNIGSGLLLVAKKKAK